MAARCRPLLILGIIHHDIAMRVFLDTNVILTGAFTARGPSASLGSLAKATFLYSRCVLDECNHLIENNAPNEQVVRMASARIQGYLKQLRAECVPDCSPPAGVSAHDPEDDVILGAAIASNADVVCTYNIKDFPTDEIGVGTPLSVHRSVSEPTIEQYIQPVMLSEKGTFLLFGRIHGQGSMGPILQSENGTTVVADHEDYIRLIGPSVQRHKVVKPLTAGQEFKLTIRYNKSDFEASVWSKNSGAWRKEVLALGSAVFSNTTKPLLFFVPNNRFSGHIQCVSGLPRYVKDKQMASALENYSLEAVAGSLDLRSFFQWVARG